MTSLHSTFSSKFLCACIYIFLCITSYAQAYYVQYEHKFIYDTDNITGVESASQITFVIEQLAKIYDLHYLYFDGKTYAFSKTTPINKAQTFTAQNNGDQVYKFGEAVTRTYNLLYGKPYIVEDSVTLDGWHIYENEARMVLGFRCTKAEKTIDGLVTRVWFTDQLPLPVGPSNTFGLPGLPLRVETDFQNWEARQIEVGDVLTNIEMPEGEEIGGAAYLDLFHKEATAHGDDPEEDGRHKIGVELN